MIILIFAQNLNIMGFSTFRVVSVSMEPELPLNSLILTRQDEPNNLEVGQIATYMDEEGGMRTLRISNIKTDNNGNNVGFVFRGDADPRQNDYVVSENIIGRVVFVSYAIGQTLWFFHARFLLIVTTTISLLIIKLHIRGDKCKSKMTCA